MEINSPLLAHGFALSSREEPYRAIISASLRQCPLVPREGEKFKEWRFGAFNGVPENFQF